jgi:ABC-type branched-subunit amino acid transport system substrate-binding protein
MRRLASNLLVLLMLSCAIFPPTERPDTESAEETREDALTEIRTLALGGDYKELRRAGKSFLSRYADDAALDDVRLLVASADIELGFFDEATEILSPLISREGTDREKGRAHVLMAHVHKAKGRFGDAAVSLLGSLTSDLDESQHEEVMELLRETVGLLSRDQLNSISKSHGTSPGIELVLEAALSYARASQDTAAAREIIAELEKLHRDEPAVDLPFEEGVTIAATIGEGADDAVRYSIGVLCPLGGRYAPLGEEFLKGASIALKEARERGVHGVELVVGDTRGAPLAARTVTERLISAERVAALVGCVMSSSTIAAAQVAEYNQTVLLSPVATEEGITEIGEWIFQTGSDIEMEVTALARIAAVELGLERIAFLAVDGFRSRYIGDLFGREVTLRGSEVCIYAYYPEGSTDFHQTIRTLRQAAPEGLFIASDVEDLILILPQLSFYEFGVQLLGLSTWNSKRLLRMAGRDMEGAVFPGHAGSQRDEEQFMDAVVLVDASVDETNPFIIGGYKGVRTVLSALEQSAGGGAVLRDELARSLYHRQHLYIELLSGGGIPFYTVRNERLELYTTLQIEH